MKKRSYARIKSLMLSVAVAAGMIPAAAVSADVKETSSETVAMYRLYNPNSGEHFYTSDPSEQSDVVAAGWHDEGIGWYAPVENDHPVYRLYNAIGGEHHYTDSCSEKDMLVSHGWNYEGIGWYSEDSSADGAIPVLREYNPNKFSCNHNFTKDKDEHDYLISLGWKDEGIAWYAATPSYKTAFDDLEIMIAGSGFEDEGLGLNDNGEWINRSIVIEFDLSHDAIENAPLRATTSWGASRDYRVDNEDDFFDYSKTTFESWHCCAEDPELGWEKERFAFQINLPDDQSLEGEQEITLNVGESSIIIPVTLIYTGDYKTGTGWMLEGYSQGGEWKSYDIELKDPEVYITGYYDEQNGNGTNEYGDPIYRVISIELDVPNEITRDATLSVSTSWGESADLRTSFGDIYDYENTNFSWSYCEANDWNDYTEGMSFEIILPDDPSLAGEHVITVEVGGSTLEIPVTLVYEGDYATSTGWSLVTN